MTYPLGWSVIRQILIRRERWPGGYKTRGTALVHPGQEVQPDQPVIHLERLDLADTITEFPRLASPTPPYAGQSADYSGVQGSIRTNSQLISGLVPAGLRGRVINITHRGGVIIESRAAIIQGALGAGNQVAGILTAWNAASWFQEPGAILVIPGPLNFAMLLQAMSFRVAGIVASSISSRDLSDFLRTDLIALLNSIDIELAQEHLPPVTLLFTEGLGTVAMPARTITLLSRYQGSMALLSGATSIRQSIFPELIISLPVKEVQQNWRPVQPDPALTIGSLVRVCSGIHEGVIGEIDHLFIYQQTFAAGVRGRAARLRLEDGSTLLMPLTLLERIG
jgi:hypothetical protein